VGDRFDVVSGNIGGELCVLFDHPYLEAREILPVTDRQEECRSEVRSRIPRIDGREARSCLLIATFAGTVRLLAVEYAPQGNHLLAAFVLLTASRAYLEALPAEQGESAWRVDDDGHFEPRAVSALLALKARDGSIELAIDWSGIEGDSLTLYRGSSGGHLTAVAKGYWYHNP
jgi:hypothetical protein